MIKGNCSRCKKPLTAENASPAAFRAGYGRCRSCENERQKLRSRTLGGKFRLGSAQAKTNGHKWDLDFQQYAAIVASGECFYCEGPLPKAACGLDRESNGDYEWDTVLPCCGKQPKAQGPRGCNEIKSGDTPPILLFVRRWFEKYGKLPTEQDFFEKLQKFKTERDKLYQIICELTPDELRKMKNESSVKTFLASLERE